MPTYNKFFKLQNSSTSKLYTSGESSSSKQETKGLKKEKKVIREIPHVSGLATKALKERIYL